jgi:hypothetical protein
VDATIVERRRDARVKITAKIVFLGLVAALVVLVNLALSLR